MRIVVGKASSAHAVLTAPKSVAAKAGGALSWLWSAFEDAGDSSIVDSHRTPGHLEGAAKNLSKIFDVSLYLLISVSHYQFFFGLQQCTHYRTPD